MPPATLSIGSSWRAPRNASRCPAPQIQCCISSAPAWRQSRSAGSPNRQASTRPLAPTLRAMRMRRLRRHLRPLDIITPRPVSPVRGVYIGWLSRGASISVVPSFSSICASNRKYPSLGSRIRVLKRGQLYVPSPYAGVVDEPYGDGGGGACKQALTRERGYRLRNRLELSDETLVQAPISWLPGGFRHRRLPHGTGRLSV